MTPDTETAAAQATAPAQQSVASNELFVDIAEKIIEQQEVIIGPIAISQASNISDLVIDWAEHNITISGNPQDVIDSLVEQYKQLFGQIAVQTCKEAASRFLAQLPADQWPSSLK